MATTRAAARPAAPGTLAALCVSRAVSERRAADGMALPGAVHSVFARAANVRLRAGDLVSLTAPELALAPNGVAVDLRLGQTFPALGLVAGTPVQLDPGGLWFPLLLLRIDWHGAPRWEPRPRVAPGLRERALVERLARLRALVLAEAPAGGLAPLLAHVVVAPDPPALDAPGQAALPAARQLAQSATSDDVPAAAAAAARLAGLGPGLTPAGDDLLAGFLAAWMLGSVALRHDRATAQRLVLALLAAAVPNASELGRAWLPHAARGEVSDAQGALLAALFAREPAAGAPNPELVGRARIVLAHGATSGGDWLSGVVLAGRALLRRPERRC